MYFRSKRRICCPVDEPRTEYADPVLEELAFPLADLGRMDLVLAGQFTQRFGALGSHKRHFEPEFGATALLFGYEIDLHMLFMISQVSLSMLSMWSSFWGSLQPLSA
jgi:hypothetical protein